MEESARAGDWVISFRNAADGAEKFKVDERGLEHVNLAERLASERRKRRIEQGHCEGEVHSSCPRTLSR